MRSATHSLPNGAVVQFLTYCLIPVAIGVFAAWVQPESGFLAVGLALAVLFSFFVDRDGLFIALVIISSAVNMNFWLDHRFLIGSSPVSVPDLIVALFGLYGFIRWFRRPRLGLGVIGFLVLLWFLYYTVFGIRYGLESGNSFYAITQEYRLVAYATVAFLATLVAFRPERHLRLAIWSILIAGIVVSVWGLANTIFAGSQAQAEKIVYISTVGVERVGRDIYNPLYFASSALVMLVVAHVHSPEIFGRWRRWSWGLAPVFIVAMIVSLTRTIWVALAVSLCLLAGYFLITTLRRGVSLRQAALGVLVVPAAILGRYIFQAVFPTVYESVLRSWEFSFSARDRTYYGRFEVVPEILSYLETNGGFWQGVGFGNMWSGSSGAGPFYNIHNTYLGYMVIGGLIGVVLFLLVWASPIVAYIKLLPNLRDPIARTFVTGSMINWITTSILIVAMPPHWSESALFGMTLAFACRLRSFRPATDASRVPLLTFSRIGPRRLNLNT